MNCATSHDTAGVGFVAIGRIDAPSPVAPSEFDRAGADYRRTPTGAVVRRPATCSSRRAARRRWARCRSRPVFAAPRRSLTGCTGLTTAVIDGVSGLLADPDVPGSFPPAVAALIEDPTRRASLGAWGSLALAARNSPAAAVLGLLHAVSPRGRVQVDLSRRITFASTLRDVLLGAETPAPGATAMVEPEPGVLKRLARTGKRARFRANDALLAALVDRWPAARRTRGPTRSAELWPRGDPMTLIIDHTHSAVP